VTRSGLALGAALAALTLGKPANAHDPFEITALACLSPSELVVEVTMARSTALRLATGRGGPRETFAPKAFREHHAKLLALAPSLYGVESDGEPMPLRARSVALTDEGDVLSVLESGAPTGARVRFRPKHLDVLPEGYTSALSVAMDGDAPTHFKLLTRTDAVLEITRQVAPARGLRAVLGEYAPLILLLGALAGGRLAEFWSRRRSGLARRGVQPGE
jgi:hypothetical protein